MLQCKSWFCGVIRLVLNYSIGDHLAEEERACCLTYHILAFMFVLFDSLRPIQQFFIFFRDGSSWAEPELSKDKCVLLKDHNAVTLESLLLCTCVLSSLSMFYSLVLMVP